MLLLQAFTQPVQTFIEMALFALQAFVEFCIQCAELIQPFGLIRADHFGGNRRCRCALVGDKIRDGEIHFMTDAADNRYLAIKNGACDDFFIEGPQVFQRAAAARDDQHIAVAAFISEPDRAAISFPAPAPCTGTG